MSIIKLTSKRQATLPKSLCEQMQVGPGDSLVVERADVNGVPAWVLKPIRAERFSWFGMLRAQVEGKDHDLAAIGRSVEGARRHG